MINLPVTSHYNEPYITNPIYSTAVAGSLIRKQPFLLSFSSPKQFEDDMWCTRIKHNEHCLSQYLMILPPASAKIISGVIGLPCWGVTGLGLIWAVSMQNHVLYQSLNSVLSLVTPPTEMRSHCQHQFPSWWDLCVCVCVCTCICVFKSLVY